MFLAVDIGNSNTVLGLYEEGALTKSWRVGSHPARTEDELAIMLRNLMDASDVVLKDIKAVAISSTVPAQIVAWQGMCQKYLGFCPLVITGKCNNLLPIKIDNPQEVGADRLVNVYAGRQKYNSPLIIVDMGTATTFDCVSSAGEYVGGVIAPGVAVSAEALFARTAKLPRVEFKVPKSVLGHNTITALQSGILYGFAGQIDGLVNRLKKELGEGVRVIATGGLANLIAPVTETIDEVDPMLTLDGLYYIYKKTVGE